MKYDVSKGLFIQLTLDDIEKIEYVQGKQPVESITSAYNRLGCDIITNANFFSMSNGVTCGEVVDEGKIISTGTMSPYGFGFVNKKKPVFSFRNQINAIDFLGGYPCLLKDNVVSIDTAEAGFSATSTTRRGRTAIGTTPNGDFIIRAISDKDSSNTISIKNLALQLQNYGCNNAINLDGGGSTQWITPWGKYISGRSVDGFLAVWLKKKQTDGGNANMTFEKNQIVNFNGGNIYSSSTATTSSKVVNTLSKCKITAVSTSSSHPYHCISEDGKGVYGWVDASTLSEIKVTPPTTPTDSPSDWAETAWEKAIAKGITDGTNPQGEVTREMLAVFLDRLKLL